MLDCIFRFVDYIDFFNIKGLKNLFMVFFKLKRVRLVSILLKFKKVFGICGGSFIRFFVDERKLDL